MDHLPVTREDWVRIQKRLLALGFNPGPIDGLRGLRTDAAITAFKKSVGLRPRPKVGPYTLKTLFGTATTATGKKTAGKADWMVHANAVRGIHEARDYNRLKLWMSAAGNYDWRNVAWCGAFVGTVMRMYDPHVKFDFNILGARQWMKFGVECSPQYGAVLVFWRGSPNGWKGHVGLYVGEDATHYHVLGGNQSNAVTVSRIKKTRLIGARFPVGAKQNGRQIVQSGAGFKVTTNEA